MWRQTSGSVVCPSCGTLVGVNEGRCHNCGRPNPGMWGFTPMLRRLGQDLGFAALVIGACAVLYVAALALDPGRIGMMERGFLGVLSPSPMATWLLGSSGYGPVFFWGRWWTPLSANWLHGSLLHILFNMMWIRQLAPALAHLYGPGRTIILFVVSGVSGFLLSAAHPFIPVLGALLGGGGPDPRTQAVGASAALFGMFGAFIHYSRRGGSRAMGQQVWTWAIALFIFGLVFPGIDNWAHLGGFLGGWGLSWWLDPLKPERLDHLLIGLVLLVASAAAVVASVLHGLPLLRAGG
jgi:rhomboid protease GluP